MATTDNKVVNGKDLEVYSTAVKQSIRNVENKLPLIVNISENNNVITCDTSIADIQAAYNAGRNVIAHVELGLLNLLVCMEGIVVFTSVFVDTLTYAIGRTEGNVDSWTRQETYLQTLLTFDDTPTANSSNPVKSGGIKSALDDKQDIISDLSTIRSGASAGATAYQKPNTGIPKSDLDSSVLTSLGKADTALLQHQDLSSYADGAEYDSTNHLIYLKHGSTRLVNPIDATDFIKDGMVDTVEVTGGNLVITFNTDSGKEDIEIPISDIFDANNYYNKTESDNRYLLISDLEAITNSEINIIVNEVLPYDAKIEYLQSDGNQYIDTGIVGNLNTQIEIKASARAIPAWFCGSRGDNTNDITVYVGHSSTSRFGNKSTTHTFSASTLYLISIYKDYLVVNGTSKTLGASTAFTTPTNIYIMWCGNSFSGGSKVYSFKLYDGDNLLRDMIPVRVGHVGYMYDKISRQLFGNAGTGNFILGNDVTT